MTAARSTGGRTDVVVEAAPKRTFVSATDWPGWARGGRTQDAAIETFLAYGPRYAAVVNEVARFTPASGSADLNVIERIEGDSGTEFGIPSGFAKADLRPIDAAELARQTAILEACRKVFDAAAAGAVGVTLRLGPRGGGRSLEKIVRHVVEADQAYLQQLGTKPPKWQSQAVEDYGRAIRDLQDQAFAARVRGESPPNPNAVRKLWSPRYFLRRAAWHLLDHAWKLEDRSASR